MPEKPKERTFTEILGEWCLLFLMFLAISGLVYLLWNWLMPDIFGMKKLDYIQVAGLIAMVRLILPTVKLAKV
jgi:hypothetical protein